MLGKNKSKNLSDKYSQKSLDYVKQSATDVLKNASKRAIQKKSEANDNLIGNKVANKVTKVSRGSPQNDSETVTSEHDKQIPEERYISP